VAMSMPQVVQDYIRAFRRQERIKLLQRAADFRRKHPFPNRGEQARTVGESIQRWQDEDELANPSA